jgi:hypothetical protein
MMFIHLINYIVAKCDSFLFTKIKDFNNEEVTIAEFYTPITLIQILVNEKLSSAVKNGVY